MINDNIMPKMEKMEVLVKYFTFRIGLNEFNESRLDSWVMHEAIKKSN